MKYGEIRKALLSKNFNVYAIQTDSVLHMVHFRNDNIEVENVTFEIDKSIAYSSMSYSKPEYSCIELIRNELKYFHVVLNIITDEYFYLNYANNYFEELEKLIKDVKICGIYKITSPTDRVYIGQSNDIRRRILTYFEPKGGSSQVRLKASFNKHGIDLHNLIILEECEESFLNERESSWSKNAKKWISQITIEGKTKYLGLFDNEEDANKKYLETLKDL